MLSPVFLLTLAIVFFFSFYGKKTFLGFWGCFFLMLFSTVAFIPVMGPFSFMPGAVLTLIFGSLKR